MDIKMMINKLGLRVSIILVLFIGCISCEDSLINSKALLIGFTAKNEYNINEEITYKIVNFSNSTAYVQFCGGYTLNCIEKMINGSWEIYFAPVIPANCGFVSIKFEPKEHIEWIIAIIDVPGTYRFVIPANTDSIITQYDKVNTNEFIVKE